MPEQTASFFAFLIFHTSSFYDPAADLYSKPPARVTGWQCCARSGV
jgi:hypothetical protein